MRTIKYHEGRKGKIRPGECSIRARKCSLRASNVTRGQMGYLKGTNVAQEQ